MSYYQKTPQSELENDFTGDSKNSLLSLGIHHVDEFFVRGRKTNHQAFYLKSNNDSIHPTLTDTEKIERELSHSLTVLARKTRGRYSGNRMSSILLWDNLPNRTENQWYCKLLFTPGFGSDPITKLLNPQLLVRPEMESLNEYLKSLMSEWEMLLYQTGYIHRFTH